MSNVISLLDHPAISKRVFHPRSTTETPTLVVDVGEHQLGCHTRVVNPDAGWVVYFHGNGELAAESERYCSELFTAAGVNVCFVEYRGYGASSGEPALAGMLGDGERVVAALGVPETRVVAFGRSLGSLYAIELARRLPRLGGLVLESGIADLNDLWPLAQKAEEIGCTPAELNEAIAAGFDHKAKLGGYTGPLLVLHAAGDRLVLPSHAERLHDWGGGTDKKLLIFPRGNHNTILGANVVEYAAEVRVFIKRLGLARSEPTA
jgi:pimeloyl-ACP methyl ester carboxylesterase